MTHPRGTFVATTIAAAVLVTLGLGARWDDWPDPPPEAWACNTNLEAVFDWSRGKGNILCTYVDEDEIDACEAGSVMALCPEQISCTELDPMWCGTSCADPLGARYWSNLWSAHEACDGIYDDVIEGYEVHYLAEAQRPTWDGCQLAYMKEQCPELTGWPPSPRIIHANR